MPRSSYASSPEPTSEHPFDEPAKRSPESMAELRKQAIARFGGRCFWNVDPSKLDDEAFASRLKKHGGRAGLHLAEEILQAAGSR